MENTAAQAGSLQAPPLACAPCRVLVVDDDPTQRLLLSELLQPPGFRSWVVESGAAALALAQAQAFDLVLLDKYMPGLTGDETCRRLRALPGLARLPVLVLTGSGGAQEHAASLAAGASAVIAKPFQPRELLVRLALVLRGALGVAGG